ncbi:hypothetical protein JKF63_04101 [Porcisia hertigi]|uniref:Uncharacterized protein n=1 Tax=Porcisia hertigi TaxID=2761500 RepID=A0A836L7I5_9TRYP|nr:hypothetical protein JKF63_04101 [Porcisia hertigi]
MPQEQVEYFDSRTKAPPVLSPSAPVRLVYDKATPGCGHEIPRRTWQLLEEGEEVLTAAQGSLYEKYQHYFAGNIQKGSEIGLFRGHGAALGTHPAEGTQPPKVREPKVAVQRPVSEVPLPASPVTRPHLSVKPKSSSQSHSHQETAADTNSYYSSHDVPARNITHFPQDRTHFTKDHHRILKNDYEQPRGDRQAPVRKSSVFRDIVVSCDSSLEISSSTRPQDKEASTTSHVLPQKETLYSERVASNQQDSDYAIRRRAPQTDAEEYKPMRNGNDNSTHHRTIYNPPRPEKKHVQAPFLCEGEESNLPATSPRDEQDLYDRMYHYANAANRRTESRRAQKHINDAELEQNAIHGSHTNFVNSRRSVENPHGEPGEVFFRLYADAQRYNKEKREQERLIELKRRQERGEVPYDGDGNSIAEEGSRDCSGQTAVRGDEKTPTKRSSSTGRPMSAASAAVFDRLSRPNRVTIKFEKRKEQEEQQKREKEQRMAEMKKNEIEKFAGYRWGIPTKSFTFADLEFHNAL